MKTLLDREDLVFNPPELGCALYLPGLPGGGSKIYDRSPYSNIGTIIGATWVRLPSGLWCLNFDGNDDYVNCGDKTPFTISPMLTMEMWAKFIYFTTATTLKVAFHKGPDHLSGGLFATFESDEVRIMWRLKIDGVSKLIHPSTDYKNAWHYFVGTYNGTQLELTVDETEATPLAAAGTIDSNTDPLRIGGGIASRYAKGSIALPRMYNRYLSVIERRNHFNREKHLFGVW